MRSKINILISKRYRAICTNDSETIFVHKTHVDTEKNEAINITISTPQIASIYTIKNIVFSVIFTNTLQ